MARDIRRTYQGGAAALYCVLRNQSDDTVWNASAFVPWSDADLATYAVALTDRGGDLYTADMPAGIPPGTQLSIVYYRRAGGSPALTDRILGTDSRTWSGVSLSAPAGGLGGYHTLSQARAILTASALNVGATSYSAQRLDAALQLAGNLFVEEVRPAIAQATAAVSSGSEVVDLQAAAADFLPGHIVRAATDYRRVELVPYETIASGYQSAPAPAPGPGSPAGRPAQLAFQGPLAYVYPRPDQDYTLSFTYWQPFTDWAPGATDDPDDPILLNIPKRLAHPVWWFGAGSALRYGEATGLYASKGWQLFLEHIERCRGMVTQDAFDQTPDYRQYL